jgi:hypothetical protein
MKTFREYLAESKKQYAFKVKIAGDVPENFKEDLKTRLEKCGVTTFNEGTKTPVQKLPLDFPELSNLEITTFDIVTEYPITGPQIAKHMTEMGMSECHFRVKNAADPTETEQEQFMLEKSGESLLGSDYEGKVDHKDYFGDEFNKSFLQQLSKDAKERKKDLGHNESAMKDVDVLEASPYDKQDKAGIASPVGSK